MSRLNSWIPLLLLGVAGWCGSAHATVASDLCAGDPCFIPAGVYAIDDGSVLDFGSAEVLLEGTFDLTTPSAPAGAVTILAGSFTVTPTGQVAANGGGSAAGGDISITTTGDIELLSTQVSLRVNGSPGGSVVLDAGGSVSGSGSIVVSGQGSGTTGGSLAVLADGDVSLSGLIEARSHPSGTGATVVLTAQGQLDLASFVDADGGVGSGGTVDLEGCSVLVTGNVSAFGASGGLTVLGVEALEMTGIYAANLASGIVLSWGPLADPPALAQATFLPGSVQALDPGAVCTPAGDDDDDDDDSADDDDDATGDDDDDDSADDDDDATGDDDDDDDSADDDDDATGDDDDDATGEIGDDDDATGDDDDVIGVGEIMAGGGCTCGSTVGGGGGTGSAVLGFLLVGLHRRIRRKRSA